MPSKTIQNIEEGGLKSLKELDKCQVVRSEFLSPLFRPKVTLDRDRMTFSTSCVRLFEQVEYIQLLMDPEKRRLIVKPCQINTKDAHKWCKMKEGKSLPRSTMCKIFGEKVFEMMNWFGENRYKIQAVYQELEGQKLIVFNLDECQMVEPGEETIIDGKTVRTRKKYYPHNWRESFGMTYQQHQESTKVNIRTHYLLNNTKDGTDSDFTFVHRDLKGKHPSAAEIITKKYSSAKPKKSKK